MNIRPIAIGVGAALAGIGAGITMHPIARDAAAASGERHWDRHLEGIDKASMDYYGTSPVFAFFIGGGLAAGGAMLLGRGNPSALHMLGGAAALVAAGATFGAMTGGFVGFDKGKNASLDHHGTNIEAQADRLIKNFDHDGNGTLGTTEQAFPEYLYRYEYTPRRRGSQTEVNWVSIENFVKRSDTSGDGQVDRAEVVAQLRSYDGNGDGLISSFDAQKLTEDGIEHATIEEAIEWTDPWGAVYPVEW